MNTRTNTLWCKSLALLALTFALAGTALGQITIQWNNPADIVYGTILDGTQLNARAVDANGNDVPGEFRYSWNPPTPPVNARDGEDNPAVDGVTINQRELTLQQILDADADSTVDGRQNPDWRFLDVGDNQVLQVTFDPENLVVTPPARQVQIDVKPKQLTVFPRALERDFGEENYPGFEFGVTPLYPSGDAIRDPQGFLVANDNDGDPLTLGARIQRGGQDINIASIDPDGPGGYARTGAGLFFDGFVRGENYPDLANSDGDIANPAEQNGGAGGVLVTQNFRLQVLNGNNPVFRAAPVGTSGTVTFAVNPAFKNYVVSIGGSGSLTVRKATIRFEAATLTEDANAKIFGNALPLVDGQGRVAAGILKNPNFGLDNDFRLGEQEILNFITPSSPGAGATANVGTYAITLTETPPQNFNINILRDNYDLQLVSGSVRVKARDIQITAIPSNPPNGFDPGNTSGFNFKLFGDIAQPPTFTVTNPAPHHLNNNPPLYDDPRDGFGNPIANTFAIGGLKPETFSALPTVTHTVLQESIPGDYTINISGGVGEGSNYNITARNTGTFEVRRAYVVIQADNAGSFVGANQSAIPLRLFGVRSFDVATNADGSMNVANTLNNILLPGTPMPATTVVGFNNNPGGPNFPVNFNIVFSNITQVRARNYDLYFNDSMGARNFLDNATRVAVDANGAPAAAGTGFTNFLFNIFNSNVDAGGFSDTVANPDALNPPNPAPAHALYRATGGTIGRYSVDVIKTTVAWPQIGTLNFGTDFSAADLDATFLHPNTGLELDDPRNVPQLIRGTDYSVEYQLKPDGGAFAPLAANSDIRLLPADKTHQLRVVMNILAPGVVKINNQGRQVAEFDADDVTQDIPVVKRNITVQAREVGKDPGIADNPFNTPVPPTADAFWELTFTSIGSLNAVQLNAELNRNDLKIEVLDTSGNVIPAGTATTPRGTYTTRVRDLKAANGNLTFTFINGTYTITPIPVVIEWNNGLPTLTYGDSVPASVLGAVITTPNVAAADGSIVYTPDPSATTLIPDVPGQEIKAKWVPANTGSGNFAESNEIARTVPTVPKAIVVSVTPIDRIFGDTTPDLSLQTPLADLLIPKDQGQVTLAFNVQTKAQVSAPGQNVAGNNVKAEVGEYSVEPIFNDPGNRLANNYATTINNSRIKVNKRAVTVTPVSRNMEVGQNATDFVDNWETDAGRKPNDIAIFDNLASFHDLKNERARFNTGFANGNFELGTNSPTLPTVGQVFNINVDNLGAPGILENAALTAFNYEYTLNNGSATLTVVEQKVTINWANVPITYGQAIGRTGENPGNNGGQLLNNIKALNATSPTDLDGDITYTFVDAVTILRPTPMNFPAGSEVPDGIILPAGNHKIRASATPAASATNFAANSVDREINVAKRDLNIRILDSTVTYGDADLLFFDAEYGTLRRPGENDTDYNNRRNGGPNKLVNGDTPGILDQQLILISNAEQTSPAGTYFIRPAQTAEDANYNIRTTFGSQRVFDGIIRDANNPAIILVNVGPNTDGIGRPVSLITSDFGRLKTFDPANNGDNPIDFDTDPNMAGVQVGDGFLEFFGGLLTVRRAPLNVSARNLEKTEGDANPPFAFDLDPDQLRNNDTADTVFAPPIGRQPLFNTSVTATTGVGTFPIEIFGSSAANYIITHVPGTFTVLAPEAPIGWAPDPSSLVYGSPLSASQLNATSTVDGTFDYSMNPLGTVLGVGDHVLTTTFTPTDQSAHRITESTVPVSVTPAILTVSANDASRPFTSPNPDFNVSFSGFVNGEGPEVIQTPITVETLGIDGAPAGTYDLLPQGGTAANYTIVNEPGTLTIEKVAATITLSNLEQTADGTPRQPTITVDPDTVNVDVTYNGSTDLPIDAGTYEVRVISNDPNFDGFALGTFTLSGAGLVELDNLSQVFTGGPLPATVTTTPEGLRTTVTYNGSSNLPVNAGTYQVRVIVDDPIFSGFAIDILEVLPAPAVVTIDPAGLEQPVNAVSPVTVTTDPAGLAVDVLYGGVSSLPTAIGAVDVVATVVDPNYVGSGSAVLNVGRSTQTITTPILPEFPISGSPVQIGVFASASSGLPVTFEVASGSATIAGSIVTVTQPGAIVIKAIQAGDDFFAPADAEFTVTVTGQGVAEQAPEVGVASLNENGLGLSLSGSPGATITVRRASDITGSFETVMTVTLDANGNGSATVPTDGDAGFIIVE